MNNIISERKPTDKKTALVTAATGLLGKSIVKAFSDEGFRVIINYAHDQNKAKELSAFGELYKADVNNYASFEKMIEYILQKHGTLDVLVNNYGPILYKNIFELEPSEFESVLRQNLLPTFYGCKIAGSVMKRQGSGRIINIAAAGADLIKAKTKTVPYFIAKNGIIMLTKSFARELAPFGVTVNAVSPGILKGVEDAEEGSIDGSFDIPAGREGRSEDVAAAVLFFTGEHSSYITGENLNVAGGWGIDS